jgi:hypothetical protein
MQPENLREICATVAQQKRNRFKVNQGSCGQFKARRKSPVTSD